MILTPVGNRGNYFSGQDREAGRVEGLETWSPAPIQQVGAHALKFGAAFGSTTDSVSCF